MADTYTRKKIRNIKANIDIDEVLEIIINKIYEDGFTAGFDDGCTNDFN